MIFGSAAKKGMECLLHGLGHGTGIDLHRLIQAGVYGFGIGRKTFSHVAPAMAVAAMQRQRSVASSNRAPRSDRPPLRIELLGQRRPPKNPLISTGQRRVMTLARQLAA